jgi:hypothetical protein
MTINIYTNFFHQSVSKLLTHTDKLIQVLYSWMRGTADPLLDGPMAQGAYRQRMKEFRDIGQQSTEGDGL